MILEVRIAMKKEKTRINPHLKWFTLGAILFFLGYCELLQAHPKDPSGHALTQISTFTAVRNGVFDGDYTVRQLQQRGDFGLGTFNGTDGNLIAVDNEFYHADDDGIVRKAAAISKVPFAMVVYFKGTGKQKIPTKKSVQEIETYLQSYITAKNIPHAIRIDGKAKSAQVIVYKSQQRPYPPLSDSSIEKKEYKIVNQDVTMIGFWFPDYLDGVNVPGFNFYIINEDRSIGGRLIDINLGHGEVELMPISQLDIKLPHNKRFMEVDLNQ